MPRKRANHDELPVKERMGWREYFSSGLRRGIAQPPLKDMLVTHVDDATGMPTYQGVKINHIVTDGRGDDKEQFLVEVLYDAEYVQNFFYDLCQTLGFITNNTINPILWNAWFSPTEGKIYQYGATEGSRKQEQDDIARAKQMEAMIEGSTAEEWLAIIKEKRAAAIAALNSETPNNGNGVTDTVKPKAGAKAKS